MEGKQVAGISWSGGVKYRKGLMDCCSYETLTLNLMASCLKIQICSMYLCMAWARGVALHRNSFHGAKLGSGSSLTRWQAVYSKLILESKDLIKSLSISHSLSFYKRQMCCNNAEPSCSLRLQLSDTTSAAEYVQIKL